MKKLVLLGLLLFAQWGLAFSAQGGSSRNTQLISPLQSFEVNVKAGGAVDLNLERMLPLNYSVTTMDLSDLVKKGLSEDITVAKSESDTSVSLKIKVSKKVAAGTEAKLTIYQLDPQASHFQILIIQEIIIVAE